jgi:hypothetical protein
MKALQVSFERYGVYAAPGLLALAVLPLIVLDKEARVIVHDILDDAFVRSVLVSEPGVFFAGAHEPVSNLMNGLSRACLPPAVNVVSVSFLLFKPSTACLLNQIVVCAIAYAGTSVRRPHLTQGRTATMRASKMGLTGVSTVNKAEYSQRPLWSFCTRSIAACPLGLLRFVSA